MYLMLKLELYTFRRDDCWLFFGFNVRWSLYICLGRLSGKYHIARKSIKNGRLIWLLLLLLTIIDKFGDVVCCVPHITRRHSIRLYLKWPYQGKTATIKFVNFKTKKYKTVF